MANGVLLHLALLYNCTLAPDDVRLAFQYSSGSLLSSVLRISFIPSGRNVTLAHSPPSLSAKHPLSLTSALRSAELSAHACAHMYSVLVSSLVTVVVVIVVTVVAVVVVAVVVATTPSVFVPVL